MIDLTNRAHSDPEGVNSRKPWRYIVLDSAIIGLMATAASMPSIIPTLNEVWVMAKAFFIAFIVQVGVERGLKRGQAPE